MARDGDKISYAKKLNASVMPPCERFSLNKKRRIKLVAKIWMPSIDASPPNDSPLDFGWKWSTETISYFGLKIYHQAHLILHTNVKKVIGKYCMLLLPFFDCLFLLRFCHELCIDKCLDGYSNQYVFCLIGSLLFRNDRGK